MNQKALQQLRKLSKEDIIISPSAKDLFSLEEGLSAAAIEHTLIFCEKYNFYGRWIFKENHCRLIFFYEEKLVSLPFSTIFKRKELEWSVSIAIMQMEMYVEEILFNRQFEDFGGDFWDE